MKSKISSFIMISSSLSIIIFSFYTFLKSYNKMFYIKHPITILFIIIIILLLIILEFINNLIFEKKIESLSEKEKKIILERNEGNYFYLFYKFLFHYNENKKIKKVKKIDHGFDGIIELDNNIPIWWTHLFFLTIIFSMIYLISYLTLDFSNPYKEYKIAYEKQLKEIKIFEKNTPQTSLKKSFFKKNLINDGKILFEENCSTCHQKDGSGNIGPNLTDDYWINIVEKDLYKNIFSIIWNGSKKNPTMRAFGESGEIKGNDIEKISSYVYFINKKKIKPNKQKSPQGKKILIWNIK
ncbi:cbb3-type cytochrome c oxidase N-terminal domain-containing protein [Blattabacterium cuenoti]|uniref:cbb3-type cytochrome c oxidase N-terminal domain-containing protein n=1 Tax=Blattabacterium cuenoti TaxID=1653831 RepID=UPI00163B977C|nr:cbb3-type cytochrome c oxidase N-terminal domain-containing protein [Blattabacterium cuenoti]